MDNPNPNPKPNPKPNYPSRFPYPIHMYAAQIFFPSFP